MANLGMYAKKRILNSDKENVQKLLIVFFFLN